jgi:hypothetical protein
VRTIVVTAGILVAACGDDGDGAAGEGLCPTVQAWSDATVDAVDAFRVASRELDPESRRARYVEAFTAIADQREEFGERLAGLDLAPRVAERMEAALAVVTQTYADGAAEAAALPDEAYEVVAVRDGSLVTGVEKAKAVVFQALSELAAEPAADVPRACGRRGALDLSPSATYP